MIKMVLDCIASMIPFTVVTFGLMSVLAVSYYQLKKIEVAVGYAFWEDTTWVQSIGFSYDMLIGQPQDGFEKKSVASWFLYGFGTFI